VIIVDTNVWIDHLREADPVLLAVLADVRQRVHPFVVGELALGSLRDRPRVITMLTEMPQAEVATQGEILGLVETYGLYGLGIGYVDAHLLASAKLMPGSMIWTRDKQLAGACDRLGLSFQSLH
jgi:predicted nucleic acid-binding protein